MEYDILALPDMGHEKTFNVFSGLTALTCVVSFQRSCLAELGGLTEAASDVELAGCLRGQGYQGKLYFPVAQKPAYEVLMVPRMTHDLSVSFVQRHQPLSIVVPFDREQLAHTFCLQRPFAAPIDFAQNSALNEALVDNGYRVTLYVPLSEGSAAASERVTQPLLRGLPVNQ